MNLRAKGNKAKKAKAVRVHFYSYVRPSVYIRLLLCCFVRRRRRHLPQLPAVWFFSPFLLFHLRCPTFFWVAHSCCRDTLGRAAKHYLLSTICPAPLSNHMWRNRRRGSACGDPRSRQMRFGGGRGDLFGGGGTSRIGPDDGKEKGRIGEEADEKKRPPPLVCGRRRHRPNQKLVLRISGWRLNQKFSLAGIREKAHFTAHPSYICLFIACEAKQAYHNPFLIWPEIYRPPSLLIQHGLSDGVPGNKAICLKLRIFYITHLENISAKDGAKPFFDLLAQMLDSRAELVKSHLTWRSLLELFYYFIRQVLYDLDA